MSALTEFLYPAPARRTVGSIVTWWEKRRLAYNIAVGSAGLVSYALALTFASLPPSALRIPLQLAPIVLFGVMANICYFFGPAVEILIDKLWGRRVLPTGPALYRIGLTFSIGLAFFPALIMFFVWIARIVFTIV